MKNSRINRAIKELENLANRDKAKQLSKFFKTAKGEYGEGDKFLGVYVPDIRKVSKKYIDISLDEVQTLFRNQYHEVRFLAVVILVNQFQKFREREDEIYQFYLENIDFLNSWDFIDVSAPKILGEYLLKREDFSILEKLSKCEKLFQRRASIVSTLTFIKKDIFQPTLEVAEELLDDGEDLIYKAVGWTLREISKKDRNLITKFIEKNYSRFPRTALRYAIEKYPEYERKRVLRGEFKPTF